MKIKLINGNKKETDGKKAVFTTGIGLSHYGSKRDFDVMIDGEIVVWFKENGEVGFNESNLKAAGFKAPDNNTE